MVPELYLKNELKRKTAKKAEDSAPEPVAYQTTGKKQKPRCRKRKRQSPPYGYGCACIYR